MRSDLGGKERLLLVDVAFPNPRIMNNGWRAEDGPVENFSLRCREIESTLIFYCSLSVSVSLDVDPRVFQIREEEPRVVARIMYINWASGFIFKRVRDKCFDVTFQISQQALKFNFYNGCFYNVSKRSILI